jgi:hypothetical protein
VSELDVLYPTRPGENEELRYSLRSLVNLPHRVAVTVGEVPSWCDTYHVNNPGTGYKAAHAMSNLTLAMDHPDLTEDVVLMNDDFFLMEPVDEIPYYSNGSLVEFIEQRPTKSDYWRAAKDTLALLADHFGITDPYAYAIHAPIRINRPVFAEVIRQVRRGAVHLPAPRSASILLRTVYGNVIGAEPTVVEDFKIYTDTMDGHWRGMPILSTDDYSFTTHPVGEYVRSAFTEAGSYERAEQQ